MPALHVGKQFHDCRAVVSMNPRRQVNPALPLNYHSLLMHCLLLVHSRQMTCKIWQMGLNGWVKINFMFHECRTFLSINSLITKTVFQYSYATGVTQPKKVAEQQVAIKSLCVFPYSSVQWSKDMEIKITICNGR